MAPVRLALLAATTALVAGGCAAPQPWTPGSAAPDGFALDIAVIDRGAEAVPRGLVTRAVLLPDGALYFEERRGSGALPWPVPGSDAAGAIAWFPAPARRLSPQQVEAVWDLCRAQGLADPQRAQPAGRFALAVPAPGEAAHIVVVGSDERWWQIAPAPGVAGAEAEAAAAKALVARLYQLSLVAESRRPGAIAPQRHDFGPDPLARYRAGQP